MKWLCIAVFFAVMQTAPAPRHTAHPAQASQQQKDNADNQQHAPAIAVAAKSNQAKGNHESNDDTGETIIVSESSPMPHKDWWDRAYVVATCLLVIVGALGIRYAIRTLEQIRRQGNEIERQRGVMENQLSTMQGQLAQMESAGKQTDDLIAESKNQVAALLSMGTAAKSSAEAAKKSADALINAERSWVLIRNVGNPPDGWLALLKSGYAPGIVLDFSPYGNTPVRIIDSRFGLRLIPSKPGTTFDPDLPEPPNYDGLASAPDVARGGMVSPFPDGNIRINETLHITGNVVETLKNGTQVLCAYGFIEYEDAFGENRKTGTCYVYYFVFGGILTSPDGTVLNPHGFRVGGPASYHYAK